MKTLSVIRLMPTTKRSVGEFFELTKAQIMSGNAEPKEIAILLKGMEDVIKALRADKEISDLILDEVEKEGKTVKYQGATLTIKEVGVSYDYAHCNDSTWQTLKRRAEKAISTLKAREKILQAHVKSWADIKSGEVVKPPVKTSTTKVTVTLS